MEFNSAHASKAKISQLKKPEGLPKLHDNYERPILEIYEKPEFDEAQKKKSVPEIKTPEIKSSETPKIYNGGKTSPTIKVPNEGMVPVNKVRLHIHSLSCVT